MGQGTRQQRVGNAMREILTELITREVRDPRVHAAGMVSVTQVELNRDLTVARVYVSFVGGKGEARVEERALAALQAAAGFLRGPVGRGMRLQRAPELRFAPDPRAEFGQRMRDILSEDEQRGHGVEAEPATPVTEIAPRADDGGDHDEGTDRDGRGS